jgi:hypothetical protein
MVDYSVIHKDPTTVFTHDDFFMHPDIQLVLGRNFIETTSTSIALNLNHCQSVPGVFTDPGISS